MYLTHIFRGCFFAQTDLRLRLRYGGVVVQRHVLQGDIHLILDDTNMLMDKGTR